MRLIDADALRENMKDNSWGKVFVAVELAKIPTIDAVEVVRCKDCKYNIIEEWEDGLFLYGCEHPMGLEDVDAYYFCCHGERKEDEENRYN